MSEFEAAVEKLKQDGWITEDVKEDVSILLNEQTSDATTEEIFEGMLTEPRPENYDKEQFTLDLQESTKMMKERHDPEEIKRIKKLTMEHIAYKDQKRILVEGKDIDYSYSYDIDEEPWWSRPDGDEDCNEDNYDEIDEDEDDYNE
jgi:hypothetical protein